MPLRYSTSRVAMSIVSSLTRFQNAALLLTVPCGTESWYTSSCTTYCTAGCASFGPDADAWIGAGEGSTTNFFAVIVGVLAAQPQHTAIASTLIARNNCFIESPSLPGDRDSQRRN